jgi:hypothetical protein
MEEFLTRLWEALVGRVDGPLAFRFILQPAMAIFLGIRDGLRFAREGRSFLLWGGPDDPADRRDQLLATCWCIGRVFVLAVALDVVYKLLVWHWFYMLDTLIIAIAVALVPYFLVRGLVNWLTKCKPGSAHLKSKARSE